MEAAIHNRVLQICTPSVILALTSMLIITLGSILSAFYTSNSIHRYTHSAYDL